MKFRRRREKKDDGRQRCDYCGNLIRNTRGHRPGDNLFCYECSQWVHQGAGRKIVFERDNYTCIYCGKSIKHPHADHVVPVSKGGENLAQNLVTSCPTCNIQKKDSRLKQNKEKSILQAILRRNKKNGIPGDLHIPTNGSPERRK